MKSLFIHVDINIIIYRKNTFAIGSPEKLQTINPYTHNIQFTFTEIESVQGRLKEAREKTIVKFLHYNYIVILCYCKNMCMIWPDKYYFLIFIFNFKYTLVINFLIITEK